MATWFSAPATVLLALGTVLAAQPAADQPLDRVTEYRIEEARVRPNLLDRFTDAQLAVLEKINRADRNRLERLPVLVIPLRWVSDERVYSPSPTSFKSAAAVPKVLVVHQPGQFFAGYEFGRLVRWGPVSTGRASSPTPSGLFHLNWRSSGRTSSLNPQWFMRWYFNFDNARGLSLHAYTLPGRPASHGCIRLLERDARWVFDWGESWSLSRDGRRVLESGTPLWIVGRYDFGSPPPWRSLGWLVTPVELPPLPAMTAPAPVAGMTGTTDSRYRD